MSLEETTRVEELRLKIVAHAHGIPPPPFLILFTYR